MSLSPEFNAVEHLQSVIRSWVNRLIREDYKDLNNSSGNWTPEIGTSRGSMRQALTHDDNDSLIMTIARLLLYYFVVNKAATLQAPIYGIPVATYQEEEAAFHPQIELFFSQDMAAVPRGKRAVRARINFRVMGETVKTINPAKALLLAMAIKNEFTTANQGYVFTKGKYIVSYVDKEYGYYLQIYSSSKLEGENVIKKILKIQNHPYDSEKLALHSPEKNSINNPAGTNLVYGKSVDKPRWRPTANVQFRWATLKLSGMLSEVVLVDTTRQYRDALMKTY